MELRQEFLSSKKEIQKIRADRKISEVSARATLSKAQRDLKREMDQVEEGVGRFLIKQKAENSRFHA
jgi:ribonuclease HII